MSAASVATMKAPIVIGGGLVALTLVGAVAGIFGVALPLLGELTAAAVGMLAGAKVA